MAAEYYGQRASLGGFIVAEATQVSGYAQGYPSTPGIHSAEQTKSWRTVTDAVHARGGVIFLQLWHVGRASHSSIQPDGRLPVGPSAIAIKTELALSPQWQQLPYETPRALDLDEIPAIVEAFREAAHNAMTAGFDGVEVHGANGYLLEQFLHDSSNKRVDQYGGSMENRARLLLEVTSAVVDIWGPDRVGVRLSPFSTFNDVGDSDPIGLYSHVLPELGKFDIAYLSLIEAHKGMEIDPPSAVDQLRPLWPNTLILSGGFSKESAEEAIRSGQADAIGFGRLFISNPDLPTRLKLGSALNSYDRSTFYGGDAAGYIDYTALGEKV
jgi:N-ethylmaleimide reductase